MAKDKDFVKYASLYTMNGLVDPRLIDGYIALKRKEDEKKFSARWSKFVGSVKGLFERSTTGTRAHV